MIALPPGARVWLACGATDMRRGMPGLALQVQEGLGRDPHAGDLFVFRGRHGSLLKILWHVALCQAAREGALHMAGAEGWGGRDLDSTTCLHAGRHRLAEPAPDLAAILGGIRLTRRIIVSKLLTL